MICFYNKIFFILVYLGTTQQSEVVSKLSFTRHSLLIEQDIIMKRIAHYSVILISLSVIVTTAQAAVQLTGIGNYFQALVTSSGTPRITYSGRIVAGKEVIRAEVKPVVYSGGRSEILQPINLPLPVTIDVTFSQGTNVRPYQIIIEEVTDRNQLLACQGQARTVQARMTLGGTNVQKVCVPYTVSTLPTAVTGIRSGEFDNIALLIGPLGVNEKYDPQDVTSLPFKFGLMAWTSIKSPWNTKAIAEAYEDNSGYKFSQPLRVLQGFAALGGGPIPRAGFGSINHIYNDTDYILTLSRSSTASPELATYNITQVVPPRSAMPYALVWVPNIDGKSLVYSGHDGIRATALMRGETARPPDAISRSEIKDSNIQADTALPDDFLEILDMIAQSQTVKMTNDAAELLGIKLWDQEMYSAYRDFDASDNYYNIATVTNDKKTRIQKCSVTDGTCEEKTVELPTPAFGPTGIPNYYNLIAHKDTNGEFAVSLYPAQLVPPR